MTRTLICYRRRICINIVQEWYIAYVRWIQTDRAFMDGFNWKHGNIISAYRWYDIIDVIKWILHIRYTEQKKSMPRTQSMFISILGDKDQHGQTLTCEWKNSHNHFSVWECSTEWNRETLNRLWTTYYICIAYQFDKNQRNSLCQSVNRTECSISTQ